jgi:hypothetical protein
MYDPDSVDHAVEILTKSDPERLIQHEVGHCIFHCTTYAYQNPKKFNQWLHHDFVPKCGVETQKRLKSSLNSISKVKEPTLISKDGWETTFQSFWAKSKTPRKSPQTALQALEELEAQSTREQCTYLRNIDPKKFWNKQQGPSSSHVHMASLNRLLHTYQEFERLRERSKHGRRFTTLLIWYQVHRELKKIGAGDGFHMSGVDSDVSIAIENVAADHSVEVEVIEKRRYEANGWLRLISQFGPGALLLPMRNNV